MHPFRAAVLCLLLSATATAQPLSVIMRDVDFSGLPRVTLRACVERNGQLVRGLDSTNFVLTENGVPRAFRTIRCPDPAAYNSVVLVIDNSGSIANALPKIVEAAGIMIDSLDPGDECAIVTFGRSIIVRQDFTTNHALLDAALGTLVADGGTPLFDATDLAIQMLAARSGNRHAVVLTDGEDNQSSVTVDDVIAHAGADRVRLYTIGFDIALPIQQIMSRMALETGGIPFFVQRPSELNAVYTRIANEITEKCCICEYDAAACADSVRDLFLTVSDSGETAFDRQIFVSPRRDPHTTLVLDVPDELAPGATDVGTVTMIPPPSPDLELTLAFTVTFDENLLDILPPLPLTLGTVAQNQLVLIDRVAPGEVRFSFNRIKPAVATGKLVGFPLQARLADSSRRVPVSIRLDDVAIAGCPTDFSATPDSVLVCQCRAPLDVRFQHPPVVFAGDRIDVPMVVRGGLTTSVGAYLEIDADIPFDAVDLDVTPGTLFPAGALTWSRPAADRIELRVPDAALPRDTSGLLCVVSFTAPSTAKAAVLKCAIRSADLWQRCCPAPGAFDSMTVIVEGACERILVPADAPTIAVSPQPIAANGGPATIAVRIPHAMADRMFTLAVVDMSGRVIGTLFERRLPEGETRAALDASRLTAGSYGIVLAGDAEMAFRGIVVIR